MAASAEDGHPQVLSVRTANGETEQTWSHVLIGLRERELSSVQLVVSDHHAGLGASPAGALPESAVAAVPAPLPVERPEVGEPGAEARKLAVHPAQLFPLTVPEE